MENTKNILTLLNQYKGVIYDFDGTIATIDIDWQILKNDLSKFVQQKKGIDIEFTPIDNKLIECKEKFGKDFYNELLGIIAHREMQSGLRNINQLLISYIKSSSQKQALFTMNTTDAIEKYISELFGDIQLFHVIITKNNCKKPKPSADDILALCQKWGLSKDEVVYIGNSEVDRISGQLAEIKTHIITL